MAKLFCIVLLIPAICAYVMQINVTPTNHRNCIGPGPVEGYNSIERVSRILKVMFHICTIDG